MRPDEYRSLDAVALAGLVAGGEVEARHLLALARERAGVVNPQLNAVVRWLPDQADAQVSAPLPGPLGGVPFLIKDFGQEYRGVPLQSGSASRAGYVPGEHSAVVQRWLAAGLVIFGQTNTPEFAAKGITESRLYGPARNPWDLGRTPGGSSGGAAAAVAAGVVPAAGGNDGGGSIRIPAACCGLFGLKVGRGVLPSGPFRAEGLHGAAVDGVVSRTVRDTAALLDVMRGTTPDAPFQLAAADASWLAQLDEPIRPLRIGVRTRTSVGPTHPEAQAAADAAVKLLTELGHTVAEVPPDPAADQLAEDFLLPWFAHVAAEVDNPPPGASGSSSGLEFDTRLMAAIGRATRASDLEASLARWHQHTRALSSLHATHDLLLTPSLAQPPVRIGSLDTSWYEQLGGNLVMVLRAGRLLPRLGVVKSAIRRNLGWVPFTQLANLTGRPAVSVPLHWTAEGLPLGVQFIAPVGGEPLLLRLGAQLEQAQPWADRRPAI